MLSRRAMRSRRSATAACLARTSVTDGGMQQPLGQCLFSDRGSCGAEKLKQTGRPEEVEVSGEEAVCVVGLWQPWVQPGPTVLYASESVLVPRGATSGSRACGEGLGVEVSGDGEADPGHGEPLPMDVVLCEGEPGDCQQHGRPSEPQVAEAKMLAATACYLSLARIQTCAVDVGGSGGVRGFTRHWSVMVQVVEGKVRCAVVSRVVTKP